MIRLKELSFLTLVLVLIAPLMACQTSPLVTFTQIQVGQDKDTVLELLGGPNWTERHHGIDRWIYLIYKDGQPIERQIHFKNGSVIYSGKPMSPFITAEEQDRINERKNIQMNRIYQKIPKKSSFSKAPKGSNSTR